MIRKLILITLLTMVVLVGCQKAAEPEDTITTPAETTETPADTTETPDISIDSEITEIDSLEDELNMDDLENIDSELDDINW